MNYFFDGAVPENPPPPPTPNPFTVPTSEPFAQPKQKAFASRMKDAKRKHNSRGRSTFVMKARKTNASQIRHYSNLGGASCGCKDCNHFLSLNFDTVKHYRELFWLGDSESGKAANRYLRRKAVWTMLREIYKEEYRCLVRKNPLAKVDEEIKFSRCAYRVRCQVTGRQIPLCFTAFCGLTGLSRENVQALRRMAVLNIAPPRDRHAEEALRKQQESGEWLAVSAFIEALAQDLADCSPDTRVTELPSGHKADYYDMFRGEWTVLVRQGVYHRTKFPFSDPNKPPSKSFFYKVWRTQFAHIGVPKRQNRFSKCDWCVSLKHNLQCARESRCKDYVEVQYWKGRLFDHYRYVSLQRRVYHQQRREAAERPSE
jgi:hypothetical protein